MLKLTCILGLAAMSVCAEPFADANSRMFAHLAPVFQRDEERLIADQKRPVLGGATLGSLEEASARVMRLIESGTIPKEKGERLIHSLEAAQKVRKLASLLDGGIVRGL